MKAQLSQISMIFTIRTIIVFNIQAQTTPIIGWAKSFSLTGRTLHVEFMTPFINEGILTAGRTIIPYPSGAK